MLASQNHLQRLDPALIRPGRVDVIHQIGHATPSQARRMFLKFFPAQDALAHEFVHRLDGSPISMALLQSYFMLHRSSAEDACSSAAELVAGLERSTPGVPMQQHMSERAAAASARMTSAAEQEGGGGRAAAAAPEAPSRSGPVHTTPSTSVRRQAQEWVQDPLTGQLTEKK